ncbi:uncharacterized protein LOC113562970 [Ooceraea biroi]|uniref:uncharacterized protein LOC113562970 n=1 Tax=Ooceraea biroi TaxID=2015173 RepID=UPI000F07B429|nr:uncharacterized protein LOC113562970 [Ooceraea biroi]
MPDIGLDKTRVRYTNTGALLIEVGGPENKTKADALAGHLREMLRDGASVRRPVKMAELRFVGLDESVTSGEVANVIAQIGECPVDEVRVGVIKPLRNGLGIVWAQCPLAAAIKVSNQGKVRLGWMLVRAELMRAKPLRCFHCLEVGHVARGCTRPDRTAVCFRCSQPGHRATDCKAATPSCILCREAGLPAEHRVGSAQCQPVVADARGGGRRAAPPAGSRPAR